MLLTERLHRPVKSMLVQLVQKSGVREVIGFACSAMISVRSDSVLPNVVLASLRKSRDEFEEAGNAYLRAGSVEARSSKYKSAAIVMYLKARKPDRAAEVFNELIRAARDADWFDSVERAVQAFCSAREAKRLEAEIGRLDEKSDPDSDNVTATLRLLLDLFDRPLEPAQGAGAASLEATIRHRTSAKYAQISSRKRSVSEIVDSLTLVPTALRDFASIEIDEEAPKKWRVRNTGDQGVPERRLSGEVHVFAEAGTDLRCIQTSTDDTPRRFVLYALDDQQAREGGALGMEVRSARDLVPDQSPVTDVAYAHAERLARWIVYRLWHRGGSRVLVEFLEEQHDAVQTGLEDRIARVFINLETLLAIAGKSEGSGDFLLIASGDSSILHCVPWLFSQVDPGRVWLLAPFATLRARQAFLRGAVKIAKAGTRSIYGTEEALSGQLGEFKSVSSQTLDSWWGKIGPQIRDAASALCQGAVGSENILVAHLGDRNYGDANWLLAERLVRDAPLFVVAASILLTRRWEEAKARGFPVSLRMQSLPELFEKFMANRPVPKTTQDLFQAIARDREWRLFTYRGERVWQLLNQSLHYWFRRDLLRSMVDHIFIRAVCERVCDGVLVLSPGRARCSQIAAQVGKGLSIPSVDVQMLNTPEYRKYKPPVADVVTVIDDMAKDVFEGHFGIRPERLRVVGSPKLDMMRDEVSRCDRHAIAREIGLESIPGPVICFASQMQHLKHCLGIVRIIVEYLRSAPDVSLVVKLHPREDSARESAYARALEDLNAGGRAVLVRNMDMTRLLAISDILITLYSNAAREALVLGRKVIICNFTGEPWPLRFDVPGFAKGAYSEDELRAELHRSCDGVRKGNAATPEPGSYVERNIHLLRGSATEGIAHIVGELRAVGRNKA